MSEPGSPYIPELGTDLDIRTDLPGYRVFRGTIDFESVSDLTAVWRDDLVTFVLGCSFSFEAAITRSGVPLRHMDANRNVPMYVTNIATTPAGRFHGPLVVLMRSFKPPMPFVPFCILIVIVWRMVRRFILAIRPALAFPIS